MNSSPEQRQGSTYTSDQTAQEVQNGRVRIRENRSDSKQAATDTVAAPTKPHAYRPGELDVERPDSTADRPEAVPHRDRRRRTIIVAVLGVLALLVTLALVVVGSSSTESEVAPATGTYTGDWKDALVERSGSQPYTGDWKDALIERSGSQPYTGDWKDMLTERGR